MEGNAKTVEGLRAQLYDDAITMLALWVNNEPYNEVSPQQLILAHDNHSLPGLQDILCKCKIMCAVF
jgi:hypothetical protein